MRDESTMRKITLRCAPDLVAGLNAELASDDVGHTNVIGSWPVRGQPEDFFTSGGKLGVVMRWWWR